jgi:hypothetical protein
MMVEIRLLESGRKPWISARIGSAQWNRIFGRRLPQLPTKGLRRFTRAQG